jgi:hypothetical protein
MAARSAAAAVVSGFRIPVQKCIGLQEETLGTTGDGRSRIEEWADDGV